MAIARAKVPAMYVPYTFLSRPAVPIEGTWIHLLWERQAKYNVSR